MIAATNTAQDYPAYGPGFAQLLATVSCLDGQSYDAVPPEWTSLSNTLHCMLLDEGASTADAAQQLDVPVSLVADFRLHCGI